MTKLGAFLLLLGLTLGTGASASDAVSLAAQDWHPGSYASSKASLNDHFNKHGREVGAGDVLTYARKAAGALNDFGRDRWSKGRPVPGATDNVRRFTKSGRYIDVWQGTDSRRLIVSFGSTGGY